MHFIWPPMTTVVLLISFFDHGKGKGKDLEILVTQKLREMIELKEHLESLQKDTEKHISSFLNNNGRIKLNSMVQGLSKEKDIRINFGKKIEYMLETYGQQLAYLVTTVDKIDLHIENRLRANTNATEVSFRSKLEETASAIEEKFTGSMAKLNQTLGNLYEEINQWRVPKQVPHCGDGWTEFQASCYAFIHINMSWFAAEQYCQVLGSHLIRIDNRHEFQFIRAIVNELHRKRLKNGTQTISWYWTAGNDIIKEGHYVWTPWNVPIRYANWYINEPNNQNNEEHCVDLASHRYFQMNDNNCDLNCYFICEINIKNE
ncbi:hypothetical protein ACJMK2_039311 [Sinanodonta woodiana]|uniref:C-type lectin domain-containing protein n=1 Tax=Sinanodonta woodiana TaxID=1069815 RepID=A0ABD3WBL8_SINWO